MKAKTSNKTITALAWIMAVLLLLLPFLLGYALGVRSESDASKLWEKVEAVCDLTATTPVLVPVNIDGGLGFNIVCK